MSNYSIFLDDERFPADLDKHKYVIARNYADFTYYIIEWGIPEFISFDHDLGEEKNGYHCAKYLIDRMLDREYPEKIYYQIHSQNPVGAENIKSILENWNKQINIEIISIGLTSNES